MIFLQKNEGFKDVELPSKLEKLYFFGFVELTLIKKQNGLSQPVAT